MRILAWTIIILTWLSPAVLAATPPPGSEDNGKSETHEGFSDPFYPGLPAKTLQIRYRLSGRFEGQEILAAKSDKNGVFKVRELRATDTALGLERPIHQWVLETPDFVLFLDLVQGKKEIRPNIRKLLSDSWKTLTEEQKANLNENLPSVGGILGKNFKLSVAVADYEATFLGLATAKVALGANRVWYWAKTDVVLKALGHQGGFTWTKEAIDVIQNQELSDGLFQLPQGDQKNERLEVPAEDLEWARFITQRVVALLARPLVGLEASSGSSGEAESKYRLGVPWPFPEPPGFRTENDRYRLDPNWAPYPKPPDQRTWPPPGLGRSILKVELEEITDMLAQKLPSLRIKGPQDNPEGQQPAGQERSGTKGVSGGQGGTPPPKK